MEQAGESIGVSTSMTFLEAKKSRIWLRIVARFCAALQDMAGPKLEGMGMWYYGAGVQNFEPLW
jgi:hypothetical protein